VHEDPRPPGCNYHIQRSAGRLNIERDFVPDQRNVHCLTTNSEEPDNLLPNKGEEDQRTAIEQ
jgi:hypothetical protein